jgi:hypothetical protein
LNSPIAIWSAWIATSTVMARKMYTLASRSVRNVWSLLASVEYTMSLPAIPSAIATVRNAALEVRARSVDEGAGGTVWARAAAASRKLSE